MTLIVSVVCNFSTSQQLLSLDAVYLGIGFQNSPLEKFEVGHY